MKLDRDTCIKVFLFFILIGLLVFVSYSVRDFAIGYYNNANFKLFTVDFVKNTGAAFSLFQSHTTILIVISVIILIAILWLVIANIQKLKYTDLILYTFPIAGVLCNMFERILDGYVTDYIKMNFIAFPIFNLSDLFINIGAFLIICNILFNNELKNEKGE